MIHSYNRKEFTSRPMQKFYCQKGIIHQTSCVDASQQNRRVEQKHKPILNVARALHVHPALPIEF